MKPQPPIDAHKASRPGYPPMVVHQFTISTEQSHWSRRYDVAECGPYRATSLKSCAARKLARIMAAAGEPDGPIEARGPDGCLRYTANSLVAFGKRTLTETPGVRLARHTDNPFPALRYGVSAGSEVLDGIEDGAEAEAAGGALPATVEAA